jgi:hypothetical protein
VPWRCGNVPATPRLPKHDIGHFRPSLNVGLKWLEIAPNHETMCPWIRRPK